MFTDVILSKGDCFIKVPNTKKKAEKLTLVGFLLVLLSPFWTKFLVGKKFSSEVAAFYIKSFVVIVSTWLKAFHKRLSNLL